MWTKDRHGLLEISVTACQWHNEQIGQARGDLTDQEWTMIGSPLPPGRWTRPSEHNLPFPSGMLYVPLTGFSRQDMYER